MHGIALLEKVGLLPIESENYNLFMLLKLYAR